MTRCICVINQVECGTFTSGAVTYTGVFDVAHGCGDWNLQLQGISQLAFKALNWGFLGWEYIAGERRSAKYLEELDALI